MFNARKSLPKIHARGRSFLALVFSPEPKLEDWLKSLDRQLSRSSLFFVGKPVILNLDRLSGHEEGLDGFYQQLKQRNIQIVGIEGGDRSWPALSEWEWPDSFKGGRDIEEFSIPENPSPSIKPNPSRIIDEPVRSGQSVLFPEGDVIIINSVASGAEIVAGGSIHVYGTLRGRAIAGINGQSNARIFTSHLRAELLAINGYYMTAEEVDPALINKPTQTYLKNDTIIVASLSQTR